MKATRFALLCLLVALTRSATCLFKRKHVFVDRALFWTEAQTYCRTNYVDLSTINTPEELSKFKTVSLDHIVEWLWIGLGKQATERDFTQWSDGSKLGQVAWAFNEPNAPDNKHCVLIINGLLYNSFCQIPLRFFCYTWEPRLIVVQEMKTWMEALEHCRKFYTDLISLNTENDLFIINNRSLSIQTPSVWIGLRFLDGSWFWVNKEPLGNLIQLPSCPARPWVCGAKKVGENVWENRDCEEKMNFICYHRQR